MSIKKIIPLIVAVVIIVAGVAVYCTTASASTNSTSTSMNNKLTVSDPLFSSGQSTLYYKLEQAVGDVGIPSDSITVNLNNTVTINGHKYYKVYNYATRSAYTIPKIYEGSNDNFSQLISTPEYVSENGTTLDDVSSSIITEYNNELNNLTKNQQYNSLYQIVAEYVEGYTANNPNYKLSKNDNYEGDLNDAPTIKISLNTYKTIDNIKYYESIVSLNSKEITLYTALDGSIYVPSKTSYEEIFFPAYLNQNIIVEDSNS